MTSENQAIISDIVSMTRAMIRVERLDGDVEQFLARQTARLEQVIRSEQSMDQARQLTGMNGTLTLASSTQLRPHTEEQ